MFRWNMVPTSHLSTISFYFTSRSRDIWVSTRLASSILLAISALFFHREPSAGTHGVFVFVFIGTKCWNPQRYCLCFHIGNQVLEPTVLLSLLSYREPSAGTHSIIVFALVPRSRAPCARQRALPVPWSDSERVYCRARWTGVSWYGPLAPSFALIRYLFSFLG